MQPPAAADAALGASLHAGSTTHVVAGRGVVDRVGAWAAGGEPDPDQLVRILDVARPAGPTVTPTKLAAIVETITARDRVLAART
jgi:hypothetical protein